MALIQVRVDDDLKTAASDVYNKLGIDLSSAIRMFLRRSVMQNGIPFPMVIDEGKSNRLLEIMESFQKLSDENGNSKMTLEEINEEISKARQERKNK